MSSALHPGVAGSASGRVEVAPFFELAAELVQASSSGRGVTRHLLRLDNRGNAAVRVVVRPADVADGLRVGVPAYADAWPGRVTEVPVLVRAARRWFGRPEPRVFAVIAEAPKPLAATRLAGTRVVSPLLPGWVPPLAGVVAVAAVAAAVVIPKLHHGPPTSGQSSPHVSASVVATTPHQSASVPTTPASPPSSPAGGGSSTTPASYAAVNLISQASNATWTSVITGPLPTDSPDSTPSPVASSTTAVQAGGGGCQGGATPTQGVVFNETDTMLEYGRVPPTMALETDPPQGSYNSINGVYHIQATPAGEVFRAEVGFCYGQFSTSAQEVIEVIPSGSPQPQSPSQTTIYLYVGKLTLISVPLNQGTTQLELLVMNTDQPSAYFVWVDPLVEAATAAAPTAPPTVTGG